MKRNQKRLGLSRETLRNLDDYVMYYVHGAAAATSTCAGSGCHSCKTEDDCKTKCYAVVVDPAPTITVTVA
jgi:hypothetical protein